jgi:hypothetical protein
LVELSEARSNGCVTVPEDVISNAEARRKLMVVLVFQVLVRSRRTRAETGSKRAVSLSARSGARNNPQAVASIAGRQGWIVKARMEAGHQTIHLIRSEQN